MSELELKEIDFSYAKDRVLSNVEFKMKNGLVALLGKNGAGKSTLMKIIVGIEKPQKGEVVFDGTDIRKMGKKYYDYIGYLPQNCGMYANFTAYEYLDYMSYAKGVDKKRRKEIIDELLEKLYLTQIRNKQVGNMSGGMKQRLGIAQALLNQPQLLVLDEPTAGLDPQERVHLQEFIEEMATEKIILLSTHIIPDVERLANQILILNNGTIEKSGSLEEILGDEYKDLEDCYLKICGDKK